MRFPKYREARPKLDIREVQKACLEDRLVCWFQGPNFLSGEVLILEADMDVLTVNHCYGARGIPFTEEKVCFAVEHAPTEVDPERYFFRCPSCAQRKKTLWFDARWACGDCHGFSYRSQSLPGAQRNYQRNLARREELSNLLSDGRPHRMRNTTFVRLCEELKVLEEWLRQHQAKVPSARQRSLTTHRWMRAGECALGLQSFQYVARGDKIVPRPY